jgi:serine/threonine protein kinase
MLVRLISSQFSSNKSFSTTLDFYEFIKEIGEGSYGKVYLAIQVLTQIKVAIKCYLKSKIKSSKSKRQILNEIEFLRESRHERIIGIFEVFETSDYLYIVTEFVQQGDLFTKVKNEGPF